MEEEKNIGKAKNFLKETDSSERLLKLDAIMIRWQI